MEKRLSHLVERFPGRDRLIRKLYDSSVAFKDLIADHHEVSEELARMPRAGGAEKAGQRERLERRRADLEEELLYLMEGHQRT